MPGRRYPKREKALAVIASELTTSAEAERQTGIPHQTILRWRDDPELRVYVQKTRDEMAEEMRGLSALTLQHIRERIREFEPKELVTLLGVSTEKALLLAGDATTRSEIRDISGTLPDSTIIDAIALASGGPLGAATPDPVPTEGEELRGVR
jgi:hypothetical protein